MRKGIIVAAIALVGSVAACQKTGEGEYQVETPDVDVNVSSDTSTVRTPTVDAGVRQDTVIVNRPTVDVDPPRRNNP